MWVRPSDFHFGLRQTLLALAWLCASPVAFAQPTFQVGPEFPGIQAPVDRAGCVEYWIASSRECCQQGQTHCPKGTLRYFAADSESRLTDLSEPVFLGSLDYNVPICFVVHGDLTSFDDVRQAAPLIVKWIKGGASGQPVQIVFYTWPSDDANTPFPQLDISARGERAEFNGCYLAMLISQFPAQARVSFFGHSFGARVTAATLHLMAGGAIPGCQFRCNPGELRSFRAVFVAAAMDRDWLNPGKRYGSALRVTEWLLNIKNGADFVINLYPMRTLFGRQALGRVGFSPGDRLRMGALSARVTEWDATMGIGTSHAWAFYYRRPEIAALMAPLLVYTNPQIPSLPLTKANSPAQPTTRVSVQPAPKILRDSTRTEETSPTRSGL